MNYYSWLFKTTLDSSDFKEDDHPRVKHGEKGGQFTESNKTVEKQDDITDSYKGETVTLPSGRRVAKMFADFLYKGANGEYVAEKESPFLRKEKGDGKISKELSDILDRLFGGELVSDAEIEKTPEWAEAMEREKTIQKAIKSKYGVEKTIDITTPEREAYRNAIMDAALSDTISKTVPIAGTDGKEFETNEGLSDGESYKVDQGRKVFIAIGFPAAGKSTTFANPLAKQYKARLCDSDTIKKVLPEFCNGYGGNVVHDESTLLNEAILSQASDKGDNIVYPILGFKPEKLKKVIDYFKGKDYTVNLCFKDMPRNMALGRLLVRFLQKGRYLPLSCISKVGDKLPASFEAVKDLCDGYIRTTNPNPYGGEEKVLEKKGDFV